MSNSFITGIFYQRLQDFAKWKARGINTLVGFNNEGGTVSYSAWRAGAKALGLKYMVQWVEPFHTAGAVNPYLTHTDDADPDLVGILQTDEPDGGANVSPGKILDFYNAAKVMLPSKPVVMNLDGNQTQWRPFCDYRCYAAGADYLGFDYYVINRGEGPSRIPFIGNRLDFLQTAGSAAGGGKKYFVTLECSDQDLRKQAWVQAYPATRDAMRGPTAAEMELEVQQVIARPSTNMVLWFPEGIGIGFEGEDVMNAEQIAAMSAINTMLTTR